MILECEQMHVQAAGMQKGQRFIAKTQAQVRIQNRLAKKHR